MNAVTIQRGNPDPEEKRRITSMFEAMELAHERNHPIDDPDPDPYGYAQEIENETGLDLLEPDWKSRPDEARWIKRIQGRSRKAVVARFFTLGFTPLEISQRVKCSLVTVYRDLDNIGREWRKSYLADIEGLAMRDLSTLDYLLQKLVPAIDRGDVKSIVAAADIISKRSDILGTKHGVQVDIEQMVREVADANGFDPDKAVAIAQRISVTMK